MAPPILPQSNDRISPQGDACDETAPPGVGLEAVCRSLIRLGVPSPSGAWEPLLFFTASKRAQPKMQPEPHPAWWISGLLIPAFFTVLGAIVALFITELKERRQATEQKDAFKRAIGMELDAISEQLDASFAPIDDALIRLENYGTVPHSLVVIRNTVFTSQLGKLRDVDDPLLLEVIKLHSDLGNLERLLEAVREHGKAYDETTSDVHKPSARCNARCALLVLRTETAKFLDRIRAVRSKLPAAPKAG